LKCDAEGGRSRGGEKDLVAHGRAGNAAGMRATSYKAFQNSKIMMA
jgi:hypothetical protein